MSARSLPDGLPSGPALAELYATLLEASPGELLAPLVEASGGTLEQATREDVGYRPGKDAHLRFAATVRRGGAAAVEGWVLCAGEAPSVPLALESPLGRIAAWRVRDDPVLTGLRPALDTARVSSLLGDLGLPSDGLVLELLSYRAQRRAVVAVRTAAHELYVKCVPPDKAPALHARHVACRTAGLPVPKAVGYDGGLGLVVLTPVRGTPMRPSLLSEGGSPPPVEEVLALLEGFTRVALDEPARSALRQARGQAALLRTVVPEESARLDDLLAAMAVSGDTAELRGGVHGDFYDGQVHVQSGAVSGVVDVDGVGRGHPADDAANLLAHLIVLTTLAPAGAPVHRWLPALAAAVAPLHEPTELRRRTAAVLLGLATWPHSQHEPGWQERTRELLDLPRQVLEDGLPG